MADSPLLASDGTVSWTIHCDGTALSTEVEVLSIEIWKSVNRISSAIVVLNDGDMPSARFPVSDAESFKPGAEIRIQLGYARTVNDVFIGVVVKHSVKISGDNVARLVVECKDRAVAMTVGRTNGNFANQSDSDVIRAVIGRYSGLTAKVSVDTKVKHASLVQFNSTDWDFMLARAEANGLLVTLEAGTVSIFAPDQEKTEALTVTYGIDLIDFRAELDASFQFPTVIAHGWDLASHELQEAEAPQQSPTKQGDVSAASLAKVLDLKRFRLQSGVPLDTGFLSAWAKAQQLKSGLARIRGHVTFQGSHKVFAGCLLELAGVGQRFNGKVLVSVVQHRVEDGNWVTRAEFGLAPALFSEVNTLQAPLASGLLPGVQGLHVGLVVKLDEDPDSQYKIKVSIPEMAATEDGFWARLSHLYGSSGVGSFFIPEIGDEVVLGFFNEDPSHPVILGSLYSSKNVSPYELTAENHTKALVTRSKLKLEFDDDKKTIRLFTPGNNTLTISDDSKSITLEDQHKNKLTLDSSGIALDSPKDITLTAKGKITLNATGNIEATAKADVKHAGLNITQTANVGFTAKASATAEVSASGTTTIKGAMVMIN